MINYTGIFARDVINKIIHDEIYLELLGSGSNGTAFKCGEHVIKFTNSEGEYDCTKKLYSLQEKNKKVLNYTSKIHAFTKLDENTSKILEYNDNLNLPKSYKYIIITDYLNTNNKTKKYFSSQVFGELMKYCFINKYALSDVIKNNNQHIFENDDCNKLLLIMQIEKLLGAQDLHSGNIGYDNNGNLKGFDFDYRN